MRRLLSLLSLSLLLSVATAQARQNEVMLGVKGGHNTIFGGFTALSAEARLAVGDHFMVRGGGQYNSYSRVAVELRPTYHRDLSFGQLAAEVLLGFAEQSNIGNLTIGGGATLDMRSAWVTLGCYYRTMSRGDESLTEPFNLYYEFGLRCLPNKEQWDVNAIISNSRMCEIERHHQPSCSVEGWWYPKRSLGVVLGVNYKPAGTFNMSCGYYQLYTNLGICYRW